MESSLRIEEIAADWLARRDGEDWTDADETALKAWLESSTAHWAAYIRLRAAWQEANRLKAMGAGLGSGILPPRGEQQLIPFFGRRAGVSPTGVADSPKRAKWVPWSVAAAVAMAVAIGIVGRDVFTQDRYSTPVGGVAAIPMADGTQITLNTGSEIRVAVTATERRVNLLQGEAFFDVARDPSRPFVVLAGPRRMVAVGTRFSVRRDGDDVQVVVTEGSIRMESENGKQSQPSAPLAAGAIVRAHGSTIAVEQRSELEAEEYLTWRSGFVVLKDIPLADAVAELNRYSARDMVIEDPSIASIRVGGNFRTTNIGAFLRILQADFPVRVVEEKDRVLLRRKDR